MDEKLDKAMALYDGAVGHWPICTTYELPVTQMSPNRNSPNVDVRVA